MLLKWIVCTVPDEKKDRFSRAQGQWSALKNVDGFLGQLGGWNLNEPSQACIIAFWQDAARYRRFMSDVHDTIVDRSRQDDTYAACSVAIAEPVMDIPGSVPTILGALAAGGLLRVADCTLRDGRQAHFLEVQREVWNPAMGQAEGMLAGVFNRIDDGPERYLVVSLWRNKAAHAAYVENMVPALRTRSGVEEDVAKLTGSIVYLEDAWRVLPDQA